MNDQSLILNIYIFLIKQNKKYKISICILNLIFIITTYHYINNIVNNIHGYLKVCVCTLGKQENRYIREFVEHYKEYGVDKIFLYDNNNINGEKFEEVIKDYIEKGFVEIINFRGKKKAYI